MYHIKPDKRAETSAAMLYAALIECLEDTPYEKISITEIVNRATTGRSTFYRNFDEIVDILHWKCDRQFAEVLSGYAQEGCREKSGLLEYVFGYWQSHSEVLEILLSINRTDIIYDCFSRNSASIMTMLKEHIDIPEDQMEYFMTIRISVFVGIVKTWLNRQKKETASEISTLFTHQMVQMVESGLIF